MDMAKKILESARVIAVVGCSRDASKPSGYVPEYLAAQGYRIIPINPFADSILGVKALKSLSEAKGSFDTVDVFRPSGEAYKIAKEAFDNGAKALWLQEGITSKEAEEYSSSCGMDFVQDRCMMKEHMKFFGR